MPMTPQAAKMYRPRRPGMTADDVVTPEARAKIEAMKQGAKDESDQEKAGKAYNEATKNMAKGGVTRADGCVTKGHTKGRMI